MPPGNLLVLRPFLALLTNMVMQQFDHYREPPMPSQSKRNARNRLRRLRAEALIRSLDLKPL